MLLDQFGQSMNFSSAPKASDVSDAVDTPTRRNFLKAAACLPAILAAQSTWAQEEYHPQGFWEQPRTIWMKRADTREEVFATYWADGRLVDSEYRRLCWLMRDRHMEAAIRSLQARGKPVPASMFTASTISVVLLDILYATNGWLAYHNMSRPLVLNSGFRHQITNSNIEGAALNSRHVRGGAGDIDIPGVNPANVSAYGLWLSGGGIGWYPGKRFTHIDDGRLRFWRG